MPKNNTSSHALKAHQKTTAYLNRLCQSFHVNDQRIYRLYRAAACHNPRELATFLEVSVSAISKAKNTGKIPAEWLLMLFQVKNVFPEWILTGVGPMYFERTPEGHYESGYAYTERMEDQAALRRISSQVLAEELLRRIALGKTDVS